MGRDINLKKAEELRLKGNKCMDAKNYAEALLHYTHGIKMDTTSAKLYANRSLAFLKLQQYYYAIEDAKQTIDLDANWFKGYLRQASVEFECGLYKEAVKSYHLALQFMNEQNCNKCEKYEQEINSSLKRSLDNMTKQMAFDYQIPWIGAAIGLVAGMALITWDYVSNYSNPWIKHPILKLMIIGFVSMIFFLLSRMQRNYTKTYRETLLKPPLDLFKE